MHLFLVSGFISAVILVFFLFQVDEYKVKKKNVPRDKRYKYFKNRLPGKIISACIMFVFVSYMLPAAIWILSPKETTMVSKVEVVKEMLELPDDDGGYYAGKAVEKGKEKYVFKIVGKNGSDNTVLDASKVELVPLNSDEKPRYEKIVQYKRTRLKNSGIIIKAVNEMYCDMDLKPEEGVNPTLISNTKNKEQQKGWKETYVKEWVKLYIPKGTLKEQYNLDSI